MNDQPIRHFDEARQQVLSALESWIDQDPLIRRAVFSPDIFARIRIILWYGAPEIPPDQIGAIRNRLEAAAGVFWGGLWVDSSQMSRADREMFEMFWQEGTPRDGKGSIRINERIRSLSVWLHHPLTPPWKTDTDTGALPMPPIISFYAFKGGAGRSTALAIFAAQRAYVGERVVVIDLDLAAPGICVLLGEPGAAISGVVDYWLEQPLVGSGLDLRDYYYRVSSPTVIGSGEILVFPSGHFDQNYPFKLARLDFTPPAQGKHPLETLLRQIQDELHPNWILLDARAGISEVAGFALGGLAHLNVLFGGTSDASWRGLSLAVRRLGAERALQKQPQEDCLLVHSMIPANPQTAEAAQKEFLRRAEATFEQDYYLPDPENEDNEDFWYVRDMGSRDAPHVPIGLSYQERVAFFIRLEDLIEYGLRAPDYQELGKRIVARFPRVSDERIE